LENQKNIENFGLNVCEASGRHKDRQEDNTSIKMDLQETGYKNLNKTEPVQNSFPMKQLSKFLTCKFREFFILVEAGVRMI
jgi:hypothetical protein